MIKKITDSVLQPPVRQGTGRNRKWGAYDNIALHVHPRKVPLEALRFIRTFGLGGMCAVLFSLLAVSGILLLFVYEPFPEKAYTSVHNLQNTVIFGGFIRNIHHWSANALILVSFLHLLRVFFTSGFHTVRQFNWVVGIFLFICILFSNFTGYLLPWDQLAYWAVTISTEMTEYIPFAGSYIQEFLKGGNETAAANLLLFFTLHTTIIPGLFILLVVYHFWRVRKAGGVIFPSANKRSSRPAMVDTIPNLILREGVISLLLIAVVLMLSAVADAPLGDMANPGLSPNPAKAPWYFLGFQELLMHFHPFFAVFVIPAAMIVLILCIPYFRYKSTPSGRWFISRPGKSSALLAAIISVVAVPLFIGLDEYVIHIDEWLPTIPLIISGGLIPVVIVFFLLTVFYLFISKKMKTDIQESIQAMFVLVVVSLILLTVTGIWFRGEGMALVLPKW